jgi:hypothetical protein
MLVVCQDSLIRNAKEASLAFTRYSPGPMPFKEACRWVWTEHLPAATRLAAVVAIGGAAATTDWILDLDTGSGRNPGHIVHTLHGYRAAVLPHLDEPERAALNDRVRTQCETRRWDEGKWPPHAGHLLAPQLGLHDICARTLETNPHIFGSVCGQLLVYGLGSADEVIAAHRRLLNRFFQPWNAYAWLAVTGIDGVPELFEWIHPQHSGADERLAPLLRLSSPAIESYMTALLDTSVDKWARAWLRRNHQ